MDWDQGETMHGDFSSIHGSNAIGRKPQTKDNNENATDICQVHL